MVLMAIGLTTVRAADNNLVGMQWDAESSSPTLVLIFSSAPAPLPAEHFDPQALSIRLDFTGTRLLVPQALRAQSATAPSIDGVVARPLASGKDSSEVVIELLAPADYRVVRHGNRLRVEFGGGSKGDNAPAAGAPTFDDANAALWSDLDSLVSIERQPRLIAQADDSGFETVETAGDDMMMDDSMDSDTMMMSDDLAIDDTMEITTGDETDYAPIDDGLGDMFGDAAVVPAMAQDAFLPPIGDANEKYYELFGEGAGGVGLSDDVARRRIEGLRFRDTPVQDALRSLAAYADLNILFNSEEQKVRGLITAELKNVALGDALEAILRVNGLAAVQEGDIIQIVDRSEVIDEAIELDIRVRPLNWVRAENLQKTLEDFKSTASGAEIRADRDSNVLILKDTQKSIQQLLSLVDKLDIPEKQVTIEMRLVDYNLSMARQQGIDWNLLRPDQHSIQQVNGAIEPYGRDTVERQWSQALLNAGGEDGTIGVGAPTFALLPGQVGGLDVDGIGVRTGIDTNRFNVEWGTEVNLLGNRFNLEVALQMLEDRNIVSVLANPTVTTLNNVPARIEVIRREPYFEATESQAGNISFSTRFEDVGVTVDVTPNITNNDYVRMEIRPTQKIDRGEVRSPDGRGTGIRIDRRDAQTNVIVRDEDTVVLGGLRSLERTDNENGVPWLARVPVIGWLFKNSARSTDKTELILFVRPSIVKDPLLNEREQKQYDDIDMMWVLPDYFFDDARVVPDDFFQAH
jgi:type IV pilus secretin PilQ/predicted competence protein